MILQPASSSLAASMMTSRVEHFAVLLPSGDVLIGGGIDNAGSSLATAERYLAKSGSFEKVSPMPRDRFNLNPSILERFGPPLPGAQGEQETGILIAGGFTQCPSASTSFCMQPISSVLAFDGSTNTFLAAPSMTTSRGYCAAATLPIKFAR